MAKIDVLMATYNGGEYLREQIESILNQTFTDWRLVIRDDGSNDDVTLKVINEYVDVNPNKIVLLDDGRGNLGPLGNFNALLEYSDAEFFNFSDQDDIWKSNKLELAYDKMSKMVTEYGQDIPLLVFADREVVDSNKNILVESYWNTQGQHPKDISDLLTVMSMCVAAGSTMLMNRSLRSACLPIPDAARMHDTWIELVAMALGKVDYIEDVALSYRRHDKNVSGGQQSFRESRNIFARAKKLMKSLTIQRTVYQIYFEQAEVFYQRYKDQLDRSTLARVEAFVNFRQSHLLKRVYMALVHKLGPYGWERKTAFILLASGAK